MPADWSDRRDALPQGSVLRDYTIEEVLGHGGFGIVYKARHKELDHVVAIKEYLPSELAVREGATIRAKSAECESHFADGLRRFREEARALIEFQQHPSIVDCREFFRANGTAYLVMEYVEGLPLAELLRQREAAGQPFTESDLLQIAVPLAQGLAHIHRAGVIHRDIKPANILVRRVDRRPVLIDFGAAKQAVAEHSRSMAPYTDGYAALEQVADGQLGPWTDLYGFGAVLWRMVAGGNRPWDPPNPVKVESRANARVREADDPLPTAKKLGAGRFGEQLLEAIDECLQLRDTERIRESDRVLQLLEGRAGENQQPESAGQRAEGGGDEGLPDPVSEEARTGRSSGGRLWKIVGLAAVITVAVALAAVALIPGDENAPTPESWSFSIEAEPETATVALLNGPEAYRPGMPLPPGRYEIEVSAPGFATHRERVTHLESETLHQVQLERIPDVGPEGPQTQSVANSAASDSTAVEQERVPSSVSDAEQALAETQPEPVQIPSDENSEAVDETTEEGGRVRRAVSDTSKTVVTDLAAASDDENSKSEEVSPSNCGAGPGGWANCIELGDSYRARDSALAAEFYKQACDGGDPEGCWHVGKMYEEGDGVATAYRRAHELYRRACAGGSAQGCGKLGDFYDTAGPLQDPSRAAELYQRGCDSGDSASCEKLAAMYSSGRGVEMNLTRTAELYQRGCDRGSAQACNLLGVMYDAGNGVGEDPSRAAELFRRGCDGGEAWGCYNLALLYEEGTGAPLDRVRAAELYGRACEEGIAPACNMLGRQYRRGYGVARNDFRSAELFRRACDGGEAAGCYNLGFVYRHGEGVPQDQARSADFYHKACTGDYMSGCTALARNYYFGLGIRQDRAAAESLLKKACGSDHEDACEKLEELDRLTIRTWE